MARFLSQALTRTVISSSTTTTSRLLPARHRSSGPDPPPHRPSDADRDSESSDRAAIRKLEDAVHRIIVKRAQPDWLPFRPGSSYWVPPRSKSRGFAKVIRNLANSVSAKDPAMAISSNRGWPSDEYYFKGAAPATGDDEES